MEIIYEQICRDIRVVKPSEAIIPNLSHFLTLHKHMIHRLHMFKTEHTATSL